MDQEEVRTGMASNCEGSDLIAVLIEALRIASDNTCPLTQKLLRMALLNEVRSCAELSGWLDDGRE